MKLVPLDVPEFVRVLATLPAQFRGAHVPFDRLRAGFFLLAQLLRDLVFDGQPVAIPARNVGRLHAFHGAGLDDDVFENFVERVTDVNVAIGVGRAVMQNVQRLARSRGLNAFIEPLLHPPLDELRLAVRQVPFHGECRLGQVER